MADLLNKNTARVLFSPSGTRITELQAAEPGVWLLRSRKAIWWTAGELAVLSGVPEKYRKVAADLLAEMDAAEKQAVDDAEAARQAEAAAAQAELDFIRQQVVGEYNKLQQIVDGNAANINQVNQALDITAGVCQKMLRALYREIGNG